MKRVAAVVLLLVLGTAMGAAKVKIQTQVSPKFDFATLKAWSWNPSGPGDVKVWVTSDSKPEPIKRQYEPIIMQAVDDELTRRGLPRATGGAADFVVTYYLIVTVGSSSQQMGDFLPAVTEWGIPPFAPATTALSVYPQGSLVLDVGSPDANHVVWRAVAQAEIKLDATEAQRTERLRNVVRDVLAKLPRKSKK